MRTYARLLKISVLATAICLTAGIFPQAQIAQASVIQHNGSFESDPSGTNEVDVLFRALPNSYEETFAVFYENAQHQLFGDHETEDGVTLVREFVMNSTPIPWYGYEIQLLGADFSGPCSDFLAPQFNPVEMNGVAGDLTIDFVSIVGSVHVASSIIYRNEQGAVLNIFFDDFVEMNETFAIFFKIRNVREPGSNGSSDTAFMMNQQPYPIPEPATILIMASGLVAFFRCRKRS